MTISVREDQFLFVEKYRPQTIDECILPDHIKNTFKEFIKQKQIPTLLLDGTAGVGKTTIAKALCNELDAEYLFINGSDEGRSIDILRTTIRGFASSVSMYDQPKVIIIDEADYMNCFDGSQTVKVFRDGMILDVPISEIDGKEETVFSLNENGEVSLQIAYGIQSGESEVFEVEFEDGSIIHCTKDHPFFGESMQEAKIGVGQILFDINNINVTNLVNKDGSNI